MQSQGLPIHLTLLGGFQARTAAGEPLSLPTRKAQALLTYLALRPGHAHPRDTLAVLLWRDTVETRMRDSFRHALTVLRKALSETRPPALVIEGHTVALDPAGVEVDVVRFEAGVAQGTPEALERATALYQGELLAGLSVTEPLFEEWLMVERERLRELALEALAKLLAHQGQSGATGRAIQTAGRLLALDPLEEAGHRALMRLYARQGRRGAALRQYQSCVAALRRDLGAEPEPETRQLYQTLLREHPERRGQAAALEPGTSTAVADSFLGGTETPFVGRQAERDQLRRDREAAWSGSGWIAIVRGEAGIGKSRLVGEAIRDALDHDGRVLLGRGHESEQILPFSGWTEALRTAGVPEEIGRDLRVSLAVRRELTRLFPELGRVPAATSQDYGRLFEALASLFVELGQRRPLLVIIEDLQWVDAMTLRLLAFLSRRLRGHRVLILATVREEELATTPMLSSVLGELQSEPRTTLIRLHPLSREHVDALVSALMPAWPLAGRARLIEQLWTTSEGNPFVLVELVREVRDGIVPGDASPLPLPERVRVAIASRLGRLGERERHMLGAAAVIGREAAFPLLQRVAGLAEREAAEAAEQLVARRVLHAVGDQLDFVHDRVREVAYGHLLPFRRVALHLAAGQALEELYADGLDQIADRLSFHYSKTDDAEKAVKYLVLLAENGARAYAHAEAATALTLALLRLEQLPAGRSRDQLRLDVTLRLAHAHYFLGEFREGLDVLLREWDRVAALGDPSLAGPYQFWLSFLFTRLDDHGRAIESASRAVAEGERCGDIATTGKAYGVLGVEAYWAGDAEQSVEHGQRGVALLERTHERWWLGFGYFNLGMAYLHMGRFEEALDAEACVRSIAEELADPRLKSNGLGVTGWIHAARGDGASAVAECRQALACAPDPVARTYRSGSLGYAYVEQGDHAEAIPRLQEAVEGTRQFGARQFEGWYTAVLAEALRLAGDLDSARDAACRSLHLSREARNRHAIGWAQRTLARIAHAEGALTEALTGLTDALGTFEAARARFEAARTRLDLAEVAATQGDLDAVRLHLAGVAETFTASGAPRYTRHATALAARLGVSLTGPAAP